MRLIDPSSTGIDVVHGGLWYADDVGNFTEGNCSCGTQAQRLAPACRRPFMSLPHLLYTSVLRERVKVVGRGELRLFWVGVVS